MDLTAIPGVGVAYRDRLKQAGIRDVADLARAPDLSSLSEWSDIPPARLATFQAHALRLLDRTPADDDADLGIVLDAPPRRLRHVPLVVLRKAGIRVVAAVGALGATLRPGQKEKKAA